MRELSKLSKLMKTSRNDTFDKKPGGRREDFYHINPPWEA